MKKKDLSSDTHTQYTDIECSRYWISYRYRLFESCDFTRLNCVIYIKSGKLSTKPRKSEVSHSQYYLLDCIVKSSVCCRSSAWLNLYAIG